MSYSRSHSRQASKSQRRSRFRFLLTVNLISLAGIILIAWLFLDYKNKTANSDRDNPKEQIASQSPSSSDEPVVSPESSPSSEADAEAETDDPATEPVDEEEAIGSEIQGDSVSLALVGDILPAARVLDLMKQNGYDYPFRESKSVLEGADIAAGNLETPITSRGTPAQDKQYVFRGTQEGVTALKEAGFDFLSLANNHTLDYGWEGLSDTMDFLDDADLQHAGSGSDDISAFSPAYIESNGITVAFVSVTRVVPHTLWKADKNHPGVAEAYTSTRAVEAIKSAEKNADIVVVMIHWGEERAEQPVAHQTDLGHQFIDAGADLVIGSHPHVLQGFEAYKGKWIAYSLGNFVFTTTTSSKTSETGVLQAQCDKTGSCALKFQPMFATNSQPAAMSTDNGKALLARLSTLSIGATVEEDGRIVAQH